MDEYVWKALLADQSLVGRRAVELADLANACDRKTVDKSFLTHLLETQPLTLTKNVQSPNVAVQPSDFAYCYEISVPKTFTEETVMGGFAICVQDDAIIGVFPLFIKADR